MLNKNTERNTKITEELARRQRRLDRDLAKIRAIKALRHIAKN